MPEARVFRRAGRGKSASPVRRGESEARPRLSLTLLLYRLGLGTSRRSTSMSRTLFLWLYTSMLCPVVSVGSCVLSVLGSSQSTMLLGIRMIVSGFTTKAGRWRGPANPCCPPEDAKWLEQALCK